MNGDFIIRPNEPGFWDPEQFARMMRIRPKAGGHVPFILTPEQQILSRAMVRCYRKGLWLCHIKPRQIGSSTFFTMLAYQNAAYRLGCEAAILANTGDGPKGTARKLNRMAMRFWKHTPREIRVARDTALKRYLEFPGMDSRLTIAGVQDDEPLRGDTVQFLVCTEVSAPQWQMRGEDAFTAALNAVPDKHGMVVVESTPRHHGDALHEIVIDSERPGSKWLPVFIPWPLVGEYAKDPHPKWKARDEVLDYANKHGLTDAQAYWMETVGLPKCRNRLHRFRAEYPINIVDCFGMAGEPLFSADVLSKWMRRIDGGSGVSLELDEFVEWESPHYDHAYVVAIDPASSFARRDLFGLVVLDLTACKVVAEYTGHTTAGRISKRAVELATHYNKAIIAVEANGVGEAVLSHLLEVYGYPYVFHRRAADSVRQGDDALVPGWWSASRTKAAAISYLQDLIENDELDVPSLRILRQLLSYRGQWDRLQRDAQGGHYDLVAALAIAVWIYYHEIKAGRIRKNKSSSERAAENWQQVLDQLEGTTEKKWNTPWGRHL